MTDRIHIARRYQPIRQQMQRPTFLPARRRTAGGGNQEGFRSAIQNPGFAMGLLFALQSGFESARGKALADVFDGDATDTDLFVDRLVVMTAVGMVGISEQEDFGAFALRLLMFVGACDDFGMFALLLGQADVMDFSRHKRRLQRTGWRQNTRDCPRFLP